jgi:riboflavin synthase
MGYSPVEMFTGIVAALGFVRTCVVTDKGAVVTLAAGRLDLSDVRIGDSIAVNGCCLTVKQFAADAFAVDVSQETLDCTSGFAVGAAVNLEKALRLADRLGGHLVSGHVDGVGEVARFEPVGESRLVEVRVPSALAKYIARKGSVTVNGVSLTVNRVADGLFSVNLIPHTLAVTNLQGLRAGSRVNIEVDLLARYVERLLEGTDEGRLR